MEKLRSRGPVTSESVEGVGLEPRPPAQVQALCPLQVTPPNRAVTQKILCRSSLLAPSLLLPSFHGIRYLLLGPQVMWVSHLPWRWRPRRQTDFFCLPSLRHEVLSPLGRSQDVTWALFACVHELAPLCLDRVWRQRCGMSTLSCFCPGLSQGLCLGPPQGSVSLLAPGRWVAGQEAGPCAGRRHCGQLCCVGASGLALCSIRAWSQTAPLLSAGTAGRQGGWTGGGVGCRERQKMPGTHWPCVHAP